VGIGHGLGHAGAELVHALGVAGNAALARVPVAGGQVVQNNLQAGGVQALLDLFHGMSVGEEKLHGFKACVCGTLKTLEERHLGEQHAQVGCKTGHDKSLR
jgi:hypothetical protein